MCGVRAALRSCKMVARRESLLFVPLLLLLPAVACVGVWDCEKFPLCNATTTVAECSDVEVTCPNDQVPVDGAALCGCCTGCEEQKEGPCTRKLEDATGWKPVCLADGSYAPVQCKGQPGDGLAAEVGRCFCWSPDGERLHGQMPWPASGAHNMTCECSVAAWRAKQDGREHEAPRCSADGSFDALQCAAGVCWCADAHGDTISRAVPSPAAHVLPCYAASVEGVSFRRRCDSLLEARAAVHEVLAAHGVLVDALPNDECDPDGTYAAVQTRQTETFCSWKDKTQIESFFQKTNNEVQMDCKCARDTKWYGISKELCQSNGNYERRRENYCVDGDGFFLAYVEDGDICPDE